MRSLEGLVQVMVRRPFFHFLSDMSLALVGVLRSFFGQEPRAKEGLMSVLRMLGAVFACLFSIYAQRRGRLTFVCLYEEAAVRIPSSDNHRLPSTPSYVPSIATLLSMPADRHHLKYHERHLYLHVTKAIYDAQAKGVPTDRAVRPLLVVASFEATRKSVIIQQTCRVIHGLIRK